MLPTSSLDGGLSIALARSFLQIGWSPRTSTASAIPNTLGKAAVPSPPTATTPCRLQQHQQTITSERCEKRRDLRQPQTSRVLHACAVEKEPGQRYPTAKRLAKDLGRFLKGEAVLARPIGQAARLWRWSRRNRLVATLMATVAASLIAGIALTILKTVILMGVLKSI